MLCLLRSTEDVFVPIDRAWLSTLLVLEFVLDE